EDESRPWQFCARRLEWESPELLNIRAWMFERARVWGEPGAIDPELHLLADGVALPPEAIDAGQYWFTVPAGSRAVALRSTSYVPAEWDAGAADTRRLGVPVARLSLSGADLACNIEHTHPLLRDGFHDSEAAHRWTNGSAQIPASLLSAFEGPVTLLV